MQLPKFVTYKEIMLVYGLNVQNAKHKLSIIRSVLGKQRHQNILIAEFCQAENVQKELFEKELQAEMIKIYTPKQSKQISISFS